MVLSWEDVQEQVELQGWELVEVQSNNNFLLTCNKGHRFVGNKRKLSSVTVAKHPPNTASKCGTI
jgi:hypothetical protein